MAQPHRRGIWPLILKKRMLSRMIRERWQYWRHHPAAVCCAGALIVMPLSPATAQDIRGLEICTAEKQMERRTGCLQSNVEFLQKALTGLTRETQTKMAAAARDLAAAREEIAALKAAVAKLNSELAQLKTKAEPSSKK
jgi:hypothetical protein